MGTPAKKRIRPSKASPTLKPSHLRMLRCAKFGSILKPDPLQPNDYIPVGSLPIKGAVAFTLIRGLQTRGLIDRYGSLTTEGLARLQTDVAAGEC